MTQEQPQTNKYPFNQHFSPYPSISFLKTICDKYVFYLFDLAEYLAHHFSTTIAFGGRASLVVSLGIDLFEGYGLVFFIPPENCQVALWNQ